jgi:serine/threonine-protein kinase PpkA
MEFVARNFTPRLVDANGIIALLDRDAQATRFNNPEYAEDMFAGVDLALDSDWRENSLRLLLLVGDASGYPPEHPMSSTKKDERVLRMAAQDRNIHIMALQLMNPHHPEDQPIAERQFSELSRVRGGGDFESALVQIRTDQPEDFQQAVLSLSTYISTFLRRVGEQGTAVMSHLDQATDQTPADRDSSQGQAAQAMQKMIQSAMVEYLGADAKPPRDLVMWAADRDLTNPSIRALEVRVLLTRDQLSDLILALDRVLQAMQQAKVSNMDFFDALQGLAAQTMKRPERLSRLASVREAGLVPSFIASLPYRSEILSLTRESYASLTAEQRAALTSRLTAKVSEYAKINETLDGWTSLNPQDPAGRQVYPLQLDYLP